MKRSVLLASAVALSLLTGGIQGQKNAHASDRVPISDFVNLSKPSVLQHLVAEEYLAKATEIAQDIYEANIRAIESTTGQPSKYGIAYSMHPEIMEYGMKIVAGKVVLEIGGASGENSMLFALAGAKHVYMNDIEPNEVSKFEAKKTTLPGDASSRLESISCSVFDLLEKKPELLQAVDLIYCRNVLHFFTDTQLQEFFGILKAVSKAETEVIFTVNSAYLPSTKPVSDLDPFVTRFNSTRCFIYDLAKSGTPMAQTYTKTSRCDEDLDPLSFTKHDIYEKGKGTNGKWQPNTHEWNKLDKATKKSLSTEIKERTGMLQTINSGKVSVLINTLRAYTCESISKLFNDNGFPVERTFLISNKGHILTEDRPKTEIQQVGVIARFVGQ